MKPSEEKFLKRWEEDRKVGRLKYSITYGLAYSIIMTPLFFCLIGGLSTILKPI